MQKKIGFIVYDHFAVWQVSLLQMFLKNAGYVMDTLSIHGGLVVTDGGIQIQTEAIGQKDPNQYDLVLLPGGEVTKDLLDDQNLQKFLRDFNGLIAASCASAAIVAASGLIHGDFTTLPHIKEIYNDYFLDGCYVDSDVVVGEKLITSKGFAHFEFMMAVLKKTGLIENDRRLESIALKLSRNQAIVK